MSKEMDNLVTTVRASDVVVDAAVLAFAGIAEQIRDTAGDKAAALKLADEVEAKAAQLAAAIPAGTPAELPTP